MTLPKTMAAVVLTGHGGPERLVWSEVPVPVPAQGEVLIAVAAAGVNNTDINTRLGWYAADVTGGTEEAAIAAGAGSTGEGANREAKGQGVAGDWTGAGLGFPRIQGADACGRIVAVGRGVSASRIGERVVVQSCLVSLSDGEFTPWLGSERDGAFAQYVRAPAADSHVVDGPLSDAELAALPCAYGTAANLLARIGIRRGEHVLITGASGNVGLAAVQLAARRGAEVTAVAAPDKQDALRAAGAGRTVGRDAPLREVLGERTVDAVIDVVGGPHWAELLAVLRGGGRYAVSGAIAGPMVTLDLRTLYLKDLALHGCTRQDRAPFLDMLDLARDGSLRPPVARSFPLAAIAEAQALFQTKSVVGKIVLVPPAGA